MKRIIATIAALALTIVGFGQNAQMKILCHRGLCSTGDRFTTDENTIHALNRAQAAGADAVEFDVHLTVDGHLVIRHDDKIAPGLYCQRSSFEDIRGFVLPFGHQIPTLHEWLVEAGRTPDMQLMLELKDHPKEKHELLVRMVLDELRSTNTIGQTSILSFSRALLDEVLRQEPGMKVTLNSSSLHNSLPPEEFKKLGYTGASYNQVVFLNHPEWIKEFHDMGIETFFWMVNSTYLRDIAAELGCDWITTDFRDVVAYPKD